MAAKRKNDGPYQKVGPCLYRYRTGTYYGRFKVGGKEYLLSLETHDRKQAERNLRAKKDEKAGVDPSQGKLTLEEICDRYLQTIQHQKAATVEAKKLIVRRMKEYWPSGKLTQIGKVKPSDCDLWIAKITSLAKRFGVTSREKHISTLKEVFDVALRDRVIALSPAAHLRAGKRAKPIRKTPTFDEFKSIIADVRGQRFNADAQDSADFLEFLGLAGLGQAEAAALTCGDVDFKRNQIITFRQKTATGFPIPLYPQVRPILERLCKGKKHSDKVFKIQNAKKALAGACKRLNLPAFSQRSLRRMFITRAIEKGVDVKVIAEWQAHKDGGKLILDTYSHVSRAHSDKMAKLMSDADAELV